MKVYTNIVDVISLCVPAGGRAGAACVWFPLWCRGVGWGGTLCVNVRAKPRRNVAALRPPRSQGGLCFGGRGHASSFHITVIILSPIHPKKKRKEDYKKETDTHTHKCCTVKPLTLVLFSASRSFKQHALLYSSCCVVLLLALLPICTTVILASRHNTLSLCLSLYESIHTAALQTSGTSLAVRPREGEED